MTQPESPIKATEDFELGSLGFSNFDSPTQAWDSSGIFGSAANAIYDGFNGNWGALAGDMVGVGLDLLGVVMDPVGSILSGVINWLIEHIGFLKEPLDLIAGDPDAVTAMATTWTNISTRLQQTSEKYSTTLSALDGETGQAIDGYRKAVRDFSTVVAGGASHAQSAAQAMTVAASVVGVVRGTIRDTISSFLSKVIIKFAAASALTPITFGASQAAFIADTVASGAVLAGKNAKKVSKMVKQLEKVADDAKKSRNIIKGSVRNLDRGAGKYTQDAAKHANKSLAMVKKAAAGKLKPGELDKLTDLGKRGDDLVKAQKEATESLIRTQLGNAHLPTGIDSPRLTAVKDKLEVEVGGATLPKAPKVVATGVTQATSDQTHREQDGQVKQDKRDKEWREHWEEERREAAQPPPVYGPHSTVRSEPTDGKWQAEGEL
ncbi:hypothetical protein [Kibdelosporangium phytohabitans]|uniref:PPE family domain-containing protein n=1 Tax=Kibdelosporangium phytohabitans TaxID=860235 RepID=A0A0N7F2X0_9PSEU|nr:hypothetical protein [Kibdelosporangium phytohabitans]ALG07007.1 hypothetical protein AOZ06_08765 [Kibdelosporangium phytohabitans]MBE1468296.1 hypothetical protein [Kibdelosporangium phytohabitans]